MTASEYPAPVASRPIWLVTLADLALLLVGFFVLLQATGDHGRGALAKGMREGFGNMKVAAPVPVAAAGVTDFAVGSAVMPGTSDTLVAFVRDAVADPRMTITITGATDGSDGDVDPATGSAAVLAADRARAVAAALAHVAPHRVIVATTPRAGRRAAIVTLAFAGEQKEQP